VIPDTKGFELPIAVSAKAASGNHFALVCHHASGRVEATFWNSRAEAVQAAAELAPCSPRCAGAHTFAYVPQSATQSRHPAKRAFARSRQSRIIHHTSTIGETFR